MRTLARYIHVFVIAALVLAGVSPACEFISGKSLAEICKSDGSVEKTAVPAELQKFLVAKADEKKSDDAQHVDSSDCAFCFTSSHLKSKLSMSVATTVPLVLDGPSPLPVFTIFATFFKSVPFARGPPSLLS